MITLYDYLPSQNAYKIRLLLSNLGRPYNAKYVSIFEGEGRTDVYRAISPTGTVPAIVAEDGTSIAESNAILIHLAEGTKYLPQDAVSRAKVFQWLFFEAETIQSGIATLRHWVQTGKDKNRSEELLESKRSLSLKSLEILNHHLEGNVFLGGRDYSIADIAAFSYVHLAGEANLPMERFRQVGRWIEEVRSQDGFLEEMFPYSIDPYSHREL